MTNPAAHSSSCIECQPGAEWDKCRRIASTEIASDTAAADRYSPSPSGTLETTNIYFKNIEIN